MRKHLSFWREEVEKQRVFVEHTSYNKKINPSKSSNFSRRCSKEVFLFVDSDDVWFVGCMLPPCGKDFPNSAYRLLIVVNG